MSEENKVDLPVFYAQKAGMTRVFDESGKHVPVTVVKLIPNLISLVRTNEKDGYEAYQVAFGEKREKLGTKPVKGQLKKAGVDKFLTHFSEVKSSAVSTENLGKEVSIAGFAAKTAIDVTGTSKGKGFAGVMKRYNFGGAMATHGHKKPRSGGSIGQCATPAKVYKEKKMPGHMGVQTKTIQNLEVVELNEEQGYMLIKGSIPGGKNGFIKIAKALKAGR
jgi:large subunit ribosomal protein L3